MRARSFLDASLPIRQAASMRCSPKRAEDKGNQRLDRTGHVALAGELGADPVAQGAALGDAAPHIGQGAAAQQRIVALAQHEEDIGRVQPRLLLIALDAAAEGAARQLVIGPDRFPGREKFAALAAQPRPDGIVGDARIAQIDALARGSPAAGRPERSGRA